jgi:uncharacterized protein YigE (DUF2233 family)
LRAAIVILLLLLGAAPAVPSSIEPVGPSPACAATMFEGSHFTVCRYAPGAEELRLASAGPHGPIGSLAALRSFLGPDAARVAFAMNAGMYDPARRPLGLFVVAGRQLRPLNLAAGGVGNFVLMPNGVFWVGADGAPHVTETAAFAALPRAPVRWATQSGPLLVQASGFNPHITANGPSLNVRNAVGVRGTEALPEALFVISDEPVSFGRLARFLRDGLGCPDALYLDGGVSGLWAPALGRLDPTHDLGTFVVVLRAG